MTFAPATTDLFTARDHLSAATNRGKTSDDLCSIKVTTLRATDSLSTAGNP